MLSFSLFLLFLFSSFSNSVTLDCNDDECSCSSGPCTIYCDDCKTTMTCYPGYACSIDCTEDKGCRESTIYGNGATTIDIQCNSDSVSCEAFVYCTTSICTCTAGNCYNLNLVSYAPSKSPTNEPSKSPTNEPSFPTVLPTLEPTAIPINIPFILPTLPPTLNPTLFTSIPTNNPTFPPITNPFTTDIPTYAPSMRPTVIPSNIPSMHPTVLPTIFVTNVPSIQPSVNPTKYPTEYPSQELPTYPPTAHPSIIPTEFTIFPTVHPSIFPTSIQPSANPTEDVINSGDINHDNNPFSITNIFKSEHFLVWIVICSCIFLCCIILIIIACLKKRRNKMFEDVLRLRSVFQKPVHHTNEYPFVNDDKILSLSSASSDNDKNVSSDIPMKLRQISLSVIKHNPQNMLTLETNIGIDGENNVDVDVDHIRFNSDRMSDIMFKVKEDDKTLEKEEEQQSNVLPINDEIVITKNDDESSESTSVSIQVMDITTADGKWMIGKETVGGCSNEESTESDDESSDENEGCTTVNNNSSGSSEDVEKSGTKSDSDYDVVQQMETMS